MKIDAHETRPPAKAVHVAPRPSRPFVEVLAARAGRGAGRSQAGAEPGAPAPEAGAVKPQDPRRARAYGFDELGVLSAFGTARAGDGSASPPGSTGPFAGTEGRAGALGQALATQAHRATTQATPPSGPLAAEAAKVAAPELSLPEGAAEASALVAEPAEPPAGGEGAEGVADAEAGGPGGSPVRPPPCGPATPPVSLALADPGAGQGLSLVAAAPLTPAEAARFTRAVGDLARAHGVRIEDVQLNGEAHAIGPAWSKGVTHGHRPR